VAENQVLKELLTAKSAYVTARSPFLPEIPGNKAGQ
jgi:hypothetical protein